MSEKDCRTCGAFEVGVIGDYWCSHAKNGRGNKCVNFDLFMRLHPINLSGRPASGVASKEAPDPFFIVWNPQGQNPKVRHVTQEQAAQEARRLAAGNASQTFIVLKAVEEAKASAVTVTKYAEMHGEVTF